MKNHALLVLISIACTSAAQKPVELRLAGWTAIIEPETLEIRARFDREELQAAQAGVRNSIASIVTDAHSAIWTIPPLGLTVHLTVRGNRLHTRFDSSREQTFEWPRTGDDGRMSALILPEGEGLYVPFSDADWRRRMAHRCFSANEKLSMPFWSFKAGPRTFTYLAISDIRTNVCLEDRNGRIEATANHAFLDRDHRPVYEIEMWPGGASPIAPAIEYREGLDQFVPLTEKIRANPNVEKLLGAVHMYVWGDGRTLEFIDDLRSANIKRAWIGYDQNPDQKPLIDKRYIDAAKKAGYLIGPYDTFNNAQDPVTGEDQVSRWPGDLYPAGCIVDRQQKRVAGFAGRGCELSSEALRRAETKNKPLANRVNERLRDGANSYFLDVDAFGELHDDYSPAHPMTEFEDRANRLARMSEIRRRGLVFGSEEGVGWSVPLLDFAHGAFSVENEVLWPKLRSKAFGIWWPPEGPRIFFQPVDPGTEFAKAKYDPAFRLPLYEAAFHSSIVATDRWDVPLAKFPSLLKTRQLIELLYGVPSMWAMNRRQLRESRPLLVKLMEFFDPYTGGSARCR
ncbi:MAG TPA: glycoside hydrolase [Bryobacteraceae bacterium]|jgi:hypothetical protein